MQELLKLNPIIQHPEKVNIFGVLLYTRAHPHIIKLLKDDDYWDALDEISGKKWAIFSIKPLVRKLKRDPFQSNIISNMIPIYEEPFMNKKLLRDFNIQDTSSLPMLLVFWKKENGHTDQITYSLSGDSVETLYKDLNRIVSAITETIERITPENMTETARIFQEVLGTVKYKATWRTIAKSINILERLKSWM